MYNFTINKSKKTLVVLALFSLTASLQAQDNFGGLALYTVRDNMGKDAKGTLEKVEEAGYAYVEAAGYPRGF
jgi:hypothetical protein